MKKSSDPCFWLATSITVPVPGRVQIIGDYPRAAGPLTGRTQWLEPAQTDLVRVRPFHSGLSLLSQPPLASCPRLKLKDI